MQFDNYSIRLLVPQDLDAFYNLVDKNRPRLEDFFAGTVSKTRTLKETEKFITEIILKVREKTYFPYIIIDNSNNSIIGFIDLKNIDWNIPKSELGCYIDEKYAGKGITTRAINLFCDYCFEKYSFKKLYLRTHKNNMSARSVAEKCGFEIEGIIRRDYKTTAGKIVDLMYYGRIN